MMDILKRFVKEIKETNLFQKHERILLAVSGGMDSVTLCKLFQEAGFSFAIAHCNFALRENDSERDEQFVCRLASFYQVPIHVAKFDTRKYAASQKVSIEEAARNLRYDFFQQLIQEYNYIYVATAHHRDDATETFFLNLMRGTGIKGLHGILRKNGNIIRPLLSFSRAEIEQYVQENNLEYKDDITNKTIQYKRNQIRHQLLPLLRTIAPAIDKTMQMNIQHICEAEIIYNQTIEEKRKKIVEPYKEGFRIAIQKLKQLYPIQSYLFEFLYPFGFSKSVVKNVINSLESISGKQFLSMSHRLIKDRKYILIYPLQEKKVEIFLFEEYQLEIHEPVCLQKTIIQRENDCELEFKSSDAYFDVAKVQFPLHIRKWKAGDKFQPLGMKGKRKISDFFKDAKYSLVDKENAWLLCDVEDKIMWIIGSRIDDRYKIDDATKAIIRFVYNKKDSSS